MISRFGRSNLTLTMKFLIFFKIEFQIISVYTWVYSQSQLIFEHQIKLKYQIYKKKKYATVSFFCLSCKIEMPSVIQHSSLLWILHLKINYKTIRNLSSAMQSDPSYVSLVIDLWSHSSTASGNTCWFFLKVWCTERCLYRVTKISQKPMFQRLLLFYFQIPVF